MEASRRSGVVDGFSDQLGTWGGTIVFYREHPAATNAEYTGVLYVQIGACGQCRKRDFLDSNGTTGKCARVIECEAGFEDGTCARLNDNSGECAKEVTWPFESIPHCLPQKKYRKELQLISEQVVLALAEAIFAHCPNAQPAIHRFGDHVGKRRLCLATHYK